MNSQDNSTYLARLYQADEDASRRNLVAVIQATADQKYHLKLLKENDVVVYEKVFDSMIDCWYLGKDQFIYMEDFASNMIHYIRVKFGEVGEVKQFQLPANKVIENPIISRNLDPLIEKHACEDKSALRELIASHASPVKEPEQFIITCYRNKIFFLTKDNFVQWFAPDSHKGETITLSDSSLKSLHNHNDDHRVIGILCAQQSQERKEVWLITESIDQEKEDRQIGFRLYWQNDHDGQGVDIQLGSQGWQHRQEHPIVKMCFVRTKNRDESADYPHRTIWKDKSLLLLDTAGNVYKCRNQYSWNEGVHKLNENCIDIALDWETYFAKKFNEGMGAEVPTIEVQSTDPQKDHFKDESSDFSWSKLQDRLGPLSYEFDMPPLVGGLYERSAAEWNEIQTNRPSPDTYLARLDSITDITLRDFTAVIQMSGNDQYALRVLAYDGRVVYEKIFDSIIDSWVLRKNIFIYQESHAGNKVSYVRLSLDADTEVTHFEIPAEVVIKDPMCASLEPFVENHPQEDKQALRNSIASHKQPVTHMIASVDDKVAILCEDEVLYFRPEKCKSEEETKGGDTITLTMSHFQKLEGHHSDQKIICLNGSPQSEHGKGELLVFSENLEKKKFGLHVWWEDDRTLDIKHGSQNWLFDFPHRVIKLIFLQSRDAEDGRPCRERDFWKDRRFMVLDARGNAHNFERYKLNEAPPNVQDKCIDIATDGFYFYSRHLIGQNQFQARLIETEKRNSAKNLKEFDWEQTINLSIPKFVPENENWLMSNDPKEFLQGIQRASGKNLREQVIKIAQAEIDCVDDMAFIEGQDWKDLGFSVGLKAKVRKYLDERRSKKQ